TSLNSFKLSCNLPYKKSFQCEVTMLVGIKNRIKNNWVVLVILLLGSFLFISASPLYKGNPWVDTNAMLAIGQAWLDGRVPFRDIFEQRGPVLYVYYLVMNLFSTKGYIGLFIIETLNLIGIWYWEKKTLQLLQVPSKLQKWLALILPFFLLSSFSFENGGSPEEFAFFWILWSFYYLLLFLKTGKLKNYQVFLIGFGAALVFWMKYSLVGAWFIFILVYLLITLKNRYWIEILVKVVSFLLGFLSVTLPLMVYYQFVKGVPALLKVYFVTNIGAYTQDSGETGLRQHLYLIVQAINKNFMAQPIVLVVLTVGVVIAIFYRKEKQAAILVVLTMIFSSLLSYWSLRQDSYIFLVSVGISGILLPLAIWDFIVQISTESKIRTKLVIAVAVIMTFAIPPMANKFIRYVTPVSSSQNFAAQDLGRYISKQSRKKASTIIYANMVNMGIERFTNVKYKYYFFETTNLSPQRFPQQRQSLNYLIEHRKADYVVWGLTWGNRPPIDLKNKAAVISQVSPIVTRHYKLVKVGTEMRPWIDPPFLTPANQDQYALFARK
ncbi:hypothetical protein LHV07_01145, partial [Limosilactobacillus fermentum]|uniref:hypothetical protein n=2 Tax=Limosilactobacillus fermentum TaxID=1613 RepID=UPI001C9D801A